MTRSELINALAEKNRHVTHFDTEQIVKVILDEIAKCLASGNRIEIRGFGSFEVNERNARIGRNPKTGETVHVPVKLAPHFKAGKELRKRVDNCCG